MPRQLSLHEPWISPRAHERVAECLRSGWVSSAGPATVQFEKACAAFLGVPDAVATSSGTAALHLALHGFGVGEGEIVFVPTLTFIAPVNAVLYCGATPYLLDADPHTLGISADALANELDSAFEKRGGQAIHRATGKRAVACLPVHVIGIPAAMCALKGICAQWNLKLIEDATESLGSGTAAGRCGALGDAGCLSFNGNKILTTGGGGLLASRDAEWIARMRHLATQAKADGLYFEHDAMGFNYRMPSLNAALGLAQIEELGEILRRKAAVAARYRQLLEGNSAVALMRAPDGCVANEWIVTVMLDRHIRDSVLRAMLAQGIGVRPLWRPCHTHGYLQTRALFAAGGYRRAESLVAGSLQLPSSPSLSMETVDAVVQTLLNSVKKMASVSAVRQ